jgi:hypothetical protein
VPKKLGINMPSSFMIGSDTWINQRWGQYDELIQRGRPVRREVRRQRAVRAR